MDDAETPPDPEDGKGDQTHRAGLRLRDAEVVAATRRDMFGDGSLVDVLAGARTGGPGLTDAAPADAQPPDASAEDSQPQDVHGQMTQPQDDESQSGPPLGDSAQDEPSQDEPSQDGPPQEAQLQDTPQLPGGSAEEEQPADVLPADAAAAGAAESDGHPQDGPAPAPAAGSPPSLDVSSLDAIIDSFPTEAQVPEGGDAQPSGLNLPPLFIAAPEHGQGAGELHTGQAPVSAIFNMLGAVKEQAEGAQPGAAAPASEPPDSDLPDSDVPDLGQADRGEDGACGEDMPGDSTHDNPAGGAEPRAEPAAYAQDLTLPPHPDGSDSAPPAEPGAQPRSIEPPAAESAAGEDVAYRPADPDMSLFPDPPPAAAGGAMASPPFPERPGEEVSSAPAGLPPYIELPAHDPQHAEPAADSALPYPDDPDGSGFPEPREAPYDREVSGPAFDAAADASTEATAKIAAEATATAQALDNLQRLLDQGIPAPAQEPAWSGTAPTEEPVWSDTASAQGPVWSEMTPARRPRQPQSHRSSAVASPRSRRASGLPLRLPPYDTGSGSSVYLLGFLTGVALSVMAGLALYFLISTGA